MSGLDGECQVITGDSWSKVVAISDDKEAKVFMTGPLWSYISPIWSSMVIYMWS